MCVREKVRVCLCVYVCARARSVCESNYTFTCMRVVLAELVLCSSPDNPFFPCLALPSLPTIQPQDDDDVAMDTMLHTYMVAARNTGADLVMDVSDNFDYDEKGNKVFSHRSLSLGDGLSHNLLINNFGKANFCVRPGKAMAIGGHYDTMPYADSPYVDWSFLTRASLAGLRLELVPLPLYEYSKHSKGSIWYERTGRVDKYKGHFKMLQDTLGYVPPKMADFVMYCRYKLGQPEVPADGPF